MALRWLVAAAALLACFEPARALAQTHAIEGRISTSAGATDNANLAPQDPEPGQQGAVEDGFSSISPGLFYSRQGQRLVYILSYSFDAQLYFQNSEANSYTNQLDWQGLFLLTRRSRLGLNLSATQGETNNFQLASQDPSVQATPAGGVSFVSATAGQSYLTELSRVWSAQESLSLRTFTPIGDGSGRSSSFELSSILRADRAWERNGLGFLYRTNYFITQDETDDTGAVVGEGQKQLVTGPEVRFRRDADAFWSVEVAAGLLGVTRTDDFEATGVIFQPTAAAVARYTRPEGRVQARYAHDAAPNLLVGEVFVNDSLELSAGYPLLSEQGVDLRGGVGAQRTKQVDVASSMVGGSSYIFLVDGAVSWEVADNLDLALRYQYRKQNADEDSSLQSFTANTFLISASARYPRQQRRLSLRQAARIDGSDAEDPFGDVNGERGREGSKP